MPKRLPLFISLVTICTLAACSAVSNSPVATSQKPATVRPPTPRTNQESIPEALTPEPTATLGPAFESYKVRKGDTLGAIASRYQVSSDDIMSLNALGDPNSIQAGQVLKIPLHVDRVGPDTKIIPDSEAVYGPAYADFDVDAFAHKYNGYLLGYSERVDGMERSGPEIIQLVAERFSVGPRVLLTILEMEGGWVTLTSPGQTQIDFPMGYQDPARIGLYKQAYWIATFLDEGYYGKLDGTITTLEFRDGSYARMSPGVNPGTAAIQDVFSHESDWSDWQKRLGPDGFLATYRKLFGDPSHYAMEPVVPPDLKQPPLRLPFEDGHLWYLTAGPHAGWVEGSAWAAIDFAPSDRLGNCLTSQDWAIAAAPGRVVQAENGRLMLNLQGSDFVGNGWTLMYMHMATQGRASVGATLKTGDHIGHPSCEGGAAESSHLHFARLYNGQWIAADDPRVPMVLSGWVVQGDSQEYEGKMVRGGQTRTADDAQAPDQNGITADGGN
jgi:LasA protease